MSRQEKELYEQQEERLLAQSDAFISLLTKRGILADQRIDDERIRASREEQEMITTDRAELEALLHKRQENQAHSE